MVLSFLNLQKAFKISLTNNYKRDNILEIKFNKFKKYFSQRFGKFLFGNGSIFMLFFIIDKITSFCFICSNGLEIFNFDAPFLSSMKSWKIKLLLSSLQIHFPF